MQVTKDQLLKGLVKYTKQEVLSNITDKPSKMIIAALIKSVEVYPNMLDKIFDNQLFSAILQGESGKYDIDKVLNILTATMEEYGDFPLQLPLIKNPLVFNARDVSKLKEVIENVEL